MGTWSLRGIEAARKLQKVERRRLSQLSRAAQSDALRPTQGAQYSLIRVSIPEIIGTLAV